MYDPDHGYAVSAVYLPTNAEQTKEHQTLYAFDARHRLTGITQQLCTVSSGHACSATTATGSDTYAYDDSGNRTTVNESNGNASADYRYCHDALGQLTARRTAAACTASPDETNTFDDAGNRTQAVSGGTTTNLAYTAAGVLCDLETGTAASCTGGNVGVDDAGRLAGYAGYTYLYDAKGRLVSACDDADCVGTGFRRIDFAYDGEGHRTAITATPAAGAAVVTTFRYAGDAIVAEYVGGTLTREYTVDDAGTISKLVIPAGQTGTGTYLVTWNGHGDALALYRIETSGSLTLANSYTYSTWGLPTTATHNGIADLGFRFLYVGAYDVQWDGTYGLPLIYMHARTYSPTIGRFLQPDPSRQDAQLFVYAANSPVSKVDPNGLDDWWIKSQIRDHTATVPWYYDGLNSAVVEALTLGGSFIAAWKLRRPDLIGKYGVPATVGWSFAQEFLPAPDIRSGDVFRYRTWETEQYFESFITQYRPGWGIRVFSHRYVKKSRCAGVNTILRGIFSGQHPIYPGTRIKVRCAVY